MENFNYLYNMSDQQPRFLEKRIENPIDYHLYQYMRKFKKSIRNSELYQNVEEIINRSEEQHTLKLNLFGNTYRLTYNDRKYLVFGLSIFSTAMHAMRYKYRLRVIIPYYLFWSCLLCHENLNPYI